MQKITKVGWLVLAVLSLLVGIILVLTEPLAHSKFYYYFILSAICGFTWWRLKKSSAGKKTTKPKKS